MRATTYEEVSSGALLNPEARFGRAIDLTHVALRGLNRQGLVVGAMIFGSPINHGLTRQDPGLFYEGPELDPLGDLDVLAVTATDKYGAVIDALRGLHEHVLDETAVGLEMSWFTEEQAGNGDHTYTQPVHDWLRQEAERHTENIIGENPVALIKDPIIALKDDMDGWFVEMRKRFQKSAVAGEQLAWALSLPHIAARRSIDVLKYTRRPHDIDQTPLDVNRAGVRAAVASVYGAHDQGLWEMYQTADRTRSAYLSFLMGKASLGQVGKAEYESTIEETARRVVPNVLDLLAKMHEAFLEVGYAPYDDTYQRLTSEANMRTPVSSLYMDYGQGGPWVNLGIANP